MARLRRSVACSRSAFTLIELLVVVGIIALMLALLLPSLEKARDRARTVKCAFNQRQLGCAFQMYSADFRGRAMPLAYVEEWPITYWYGRECDAEGIDATQGFVWPYLASDLKDQGIFECAAQPLGTYDRLQGAWKTISTTYGYNGYFLAPSSTPGWANQIGDRPWQNLDTLFQPQNVCVFADTMIDWNGQLKNCALLDPPMLYSRQGIWVENSHPTTSFRHDWQTNVIFADGHSASMPPGEGLIKSFEFRLGSIGSGNDPYYVPDWREW